MNEPVRREQRTRDATQTNQFRRDVIILWKSFDLSSDDTNFGAKFRSRAEISWAFVVKPRTSMADLQRNAPGDSQTIMCADSTRS
ncbi:hypothetical protein [Bradyrhizobium sp. CCGUVB23]|uniref:hypothetical protein n=1 Tax=Bradyrhizobium sp. CCGUVB23 TaxID=2949630 RepID=UPI0020B21964|nr:hypothetical protein [Bradyrhizobium sp. CCGUVB23]MCP3458801.1 hypothetical protein [Bradyrhizobium sp. CCGUVB23]